MFEAICFRSGATPDGKIDFSLLAEALIFYGRVHFVGNWVGYRELLKVIGPHETLELIKRQHLEIHVAWNQVGVQTIDIGTGKERHGLIFSALVRQAGETKNADPEEIAQREFLRAAGLSKLSPEAKQFASRLHYIKKPGLDLRSIRESIVDQASFSRTIVSWLRRLAPPGVLMDDAAISTWTLGDDIQIAPNFDLAKVAVEIERRGIRFTGTPAALLNNYVSAYEDSYFASELTAEVSSSVVRSPLIQSRFEHLWQRAIRSQAEIRAFEDKTLESGRAIGEALQSGAATWGELLKVLEKRDRFRKWIADKPFDSDLVAEYIRELSKETWLDKIPNKAMRWAIFIGAGTLVEIAAPSGLGIAASVGLSALDGIFLDRLLKGWKPDQFVNGSLVPLVRKSEG